MSHAIASKMAIRWSGPKKIKVPDAAPAELMINGLMKPKNPQQISQNPSADHYNLEQPEDEEQNENSSDIKLSEEGDEDEEIEEIDLSSTRLLNQALEHKNPAYYYKALTIDEERRALERRAQQLKHRLEIELRTKSRKLAPAYYGWQDVPWSFTDHNADSSDLSDMWRMLRSSTAHEYPLEDPAVSSKFFDQLRGFMVHSDINAIKQDYGNIYEDQLNEFFQAYPKVSSTKLIVDLETKSIHKGCL
jgi:hypothetical protein